MKKFLRGTLAFLYSTMLSIGYMALAVYLLVRVLIYVEGFVMTLSCIVGLVLLFSWISEKVLSWALLPFRRMWDKTLTVRIVSAIPPVLVAIWCLSAPYRMELSLTSGDWIVIVIWSILDIVFYFNLASAPFFNPQFSVELR